MAWAATDGGHHTTDDLVVDNKSSNQSLKFEEEEERETDTMTEETTTTTTQPETGDDSQVYKIAAEAATKWGPALTKGVKEGDITEFRSLFTDGLVEVVIQGSDGYEACFTIADNNEEATLDWKTFFEMSTAELKEQDYVKTESQCLGVLGPRCILEVGRFNSSGEVYQESIALLTMGRESGKIVAYEAFTDPGVSVLKELAEPK